MKVAFASDHAGYDEPKPYYKPALIAYLEAKGFEVIDCGTDSPASVDYPDFADALCQTIKEGKAECGVLLCGTGIGISIAANRHPGIRAAVCATPDMAALAREHNDANVLCMGRRILDLDSSKALIDTFFSTEFSGGERHKRRINKMG